ncbi:MAG: hypothetical protein CR986_04835 [Ignavibacteriae bacterium]|nr:MAG: hypothetical protein CR986_04835 [Ignavibacteriota bacterium]
MIKEEILQEKAQIDHQLILDSTSDLIIAFTKEYEILYCNEAFKKTFKMFTKEKLEDERLLNSYEGLTKFSELSNTWNNWIERAFAGEHIKDIIKYKVINKEIFYRIDLKPIYDKDKVDYVQLVAKEDTLKHCYETLLRENKELNKSKNQKEETTKEVTNTNEQITSIYDNLREVIWDFDVEKNKIVFTSNIFETLGLTNKVEGFTLEEWYKIIAEDNLEDVKTSFKNYLDEINSEYNIEYKINTSKGKKWISDNGKIVSRNEDNKPLRIVGTLQDISLRKKLELKLNYLKKDISDCTFLIFWHDKEGNIKYSSKTFQKKLGYSEDEILNLNLRDLEKNNEELSQLATEYSSGKRETIFYTKKNEKINVELTSSKLGFHKEGYTVVSVTDVTEKQTIVSQLRESESKFHSVAENLPIMVWLTDQNINLLYANKKSYEFVGGNNLSSALHPDDYDFFKHNMLSAIKKNKQVSCELRIKNLENEYRWILADIVPRFSSEGKLLGMLGVGSDITDRKEIETKYLESETLLNEITSVVGDGIFLIDDEFKLQFANPEFENLLGYTFDELENKSTLNILNRASKSCTKCPIKGIFKKGEVVRVPVDYFVKKDGNNIPVSYVVSPINRNGIITGAVIAFHDITEQLEAEEELNRYIEELQISKQMVEENANELTTVNEKLSKSEAKLKELNANKDKFFSIISHDLRSPFSSIIGFAEVMLEDLERLSNDEIKDFVTNIYKSSKNLQNLLENLLKWSKIQTGRIEFNQIHFDLNSLINDVIALFQVNAARKQIKLENLIETDITINADKFMLDTILRNLISNSIKFTKANGIISVSVEEKSDHLLFTIEDNGVGMTEEIKNKLFKIEEHVTTKGTNKEKGSGIGLIITKEFVDIHKGKIWVESTPDVGSKFYFTIPQ